MLIFPAIDIRDGRCVRLIKGDYSQKIDYDIDPAQAAKEFIKQGAEWLHVVDLDGARMGYPVNISTLAQIAALGKPVQYGGGLRENEHIMSAIAAGASRLMIGTSSLDEDFLASAIRKYGGRIMPTADIKNGTIAMHGWLSVSEIKAEAYIMTLESAGADICLVTATSRDGTMSGPDIPLLKELLGKRKHMSIVAAGGIGDINHIRQLKELEASGVAGCVVGRALYEGKLSLSEAINVGEGR